jgi:hypothetical protein
LKIRDSKLYLESYKTFEDYCRSRWTMSATYANRLVDSIQVYKNIEANAARRDLPLPQNEYALWPLVGLSAEDQGMVWAEACTKAKGHPSAPQVRKTVEALVPPERKQSRKRKSAVKIIAECVGMRVAFDGSVVPKDFSDDDRREGPIRID